MNINDAVTRRPRTIGIVCAIGAVILGLAYMAVGKFCRYVLMTAALIWVFPGSAP